ncbi:hypothetical protein J3B02_000455 [Coemansia erecta]|nr:hypothetical protein J3B02_000455 [Coemansia erecta]KAJ2877772.1 hypothetical protein FB639_003624 [Coemansia asiatica]
MTTAASTTVSAAKKQLRKLMHQRLSSLTLQALAQQSAQVAQHIIEHPAYKSSRHISIYISMDTAELQTKDLLLHALDSGKTVYVPRCHKQTMHMIRLSGRDDLFGLKKNKWGIPEPDTDREPADPNVLDFVLVPGVAFDRNGNRCGHGRGYYDRFVASLPSAFSCAVCLSEQIVDSVPVDTFDRSPDTIIAPEGAIFVNDTVELK